MVYQSKTERNYRLPQHDNSLTFVEKVSKPEITKIRFLEYRIDNNLYGSFEVLIEKNSFGLFDYHEKQLGMCGDMTWREMTETDSKRIQDYLNGDLSKVLLQKPDSPRDNKPNWVWD